MFPNQFHRFRPRLIDALQGYDGRRLAADVGAGPCGHGCHATAACPGGRTASPATRGPLPHIAHR